MQVRPTLVALASAALLVVLTGCTLKGRLYNLDTGEMTPIKFTYSGSGRGTITGTFASGESFSGDYVTFVRPPVNWGLIYGKVYGAFAWQNQQSGGSAQQYGTAVASGKAGFVADCEYVTASIAHGSGACIDKAGTKYKIMF